MIVSFACPVGETLELTAPLKVMGGITDWLTQFIVAMQTTVKNAMRAAIAECETTKLDEFAYKHVQQSVVAAVQEQDTCHRDGSRSLPDRP